MDARAVAIGEGERGGHRDRASSCAPHAMAAVPVRSSEVVRRRARIGEAQAEIRVIPTQRPLQTRQSAGQAVIIVALDGEARIVGESGVADALASAAVLLTRNEPTTEVWRAGSRELILHLPRTRLQILASARFGGARRLAGAAPRSVPILAGGALEAAIAAILDLLVGDAAELGARARKLEDALIRGLLQAVADAGDLDEILPQARSVSEAMRQVEAAPDKAWDASALAAAAGVTVAVLRRGFRAHLGTSISTFVLEARLAGARKRLASARDSRSMAQIGLSVGFSSPGAFSRAYTRLYGESPSETRARAVRALGNTDPGEAGGP